MITSVSEQLNTPYLFTYRHVVPLPGSRNHYYFVLFLLSLMLLGSWMLYGCFMCEWLEKKQPQSLHSSLKGAQILCCFSLCVFFFQTGPFTAHFIMRIRVCGGSSQPWSPAPPGCSASSCCHFITPAGPVWSCWCSSTRWRVDWFLSKTSTVTGVFWNHRDFKDIYDGLTPRLLN